MITGSRGFIGSRLSKKFEEPIEFDILIDKRMSVLNKEALSFFIEEKKPNVIIHLAANPLAVKSVEDPIYDMNLNILGTLNLLEACKNLDLDLLLFTSTAYVNGEPKYVPMDENHPPLPTSPYGISKLACERYCEFYHKKYKIPISIIRFFNIYAEGQPSGFVIPDVINNIFKSTNGIVKLRGSEEDSRDFLYLDDLVDAIVKVVEKKIVGETINLGGGENITILDLAQKIAKIMNKNIKFECAKVENVKISKLYADISKAKALLGWTPKTPLEEGLRKVIESYCNLNNP